MNLPKKCKSDKCKDVAERQFWYDAKKKKMQSNTLICCLTCGRSFTIAEKN